MKQKTIQVINKRDVHALFIWGGDSIDTLENAISVQVYATETPIEIESDAVMMYPHDGNVLVNVRSNNIDLLKSYVEDMFPHLTNVGHPTVDGEVFKEWIAYVDQRGANAINQDITGDTTVEQPSNGQ